MDPAFHPAVANVPVSLAWVLAIVVGATVLTTLLVVADTPREEWRALAWLAAASALTRALVPTSFLQTDADDVRLVAVVRGLDLTGIGGTAEPTPALEAILGSLVPVLGRGDDAVVAPLRALGAMLPVVAYAVARRWLGEPRHARVAAGMVLASPFAIAFSATPSAELPAATLYAAALWAGLVAVERGGAARLAVVPASALLVLAAALKDELQLLAPLFAVAIAHRGRERGRTREGLVLAAIPPFAVLAHQLASGPSHLPGLVAYRAHVLTVGHVAAYVVVAFLLNPPFVPAKLAWIAGARAWRAHGPLQLHALAFVALFASAFQSVGSNQWRYALSWLVPFTITIAPVVAETWVRARRRVIVLGTIEILLSVVVLAQGMLSPRNVDLRALRAWDAEVPRLVLYGAYRQDRSPGVATALAGTSESLPLDALWPTTCAPAVLQRRLAVRTEYRDIVVKALGTEDPHFTDVRALDDDVAWVRAQPIDPALWFSDDHYDLGPTQDDAACARDLPARREALARYRAIGVLVDGEYVMARITDDLRRAVGIPWIIGIDRRDVLDRGADHLHLTEPIDGDARVIDVLAIPDPLGPERPPIWSRP